MTDLRDWLKAYNIKNSMGGEMAEAYNARSAELKALDKAHSADLCK